MADAAQVNTFQAPASAGQPDAGGILLRGQHGKAAERPFSHARKANVLFCDTHVGPETFVPGSLDPICQVNSWGDYARKFW